MSMNKDTPDDQRHYILSAMEYNDPNIMRDMAKKDAYCILESPDANMEIADGFCDACGRKIPICQVELPEGGSEELIDIIEAEEIYWLQVHPEQYIDDDDDDSSAYEDLRTLL